MFVIGVEGDRGPSVVHTVEGGVGHCLLSPPLEFTSRPRGRRRKGYVA